jgi:hypothetical protein
LDIERLKSAAKLKFGVSAKDIDNAIKGKELSQEKLDKITEISHSVNRQSKSQSIK